LLDASLTPACAFRVQHNAGHGCRGNRLMPVDAPVMSLPLRRLGKLEGPSGDPNVAS